MFITARDRGRVRDVLANWRERPVRTIVVTDGERILGLGDQGANGMGIPIGKLALYTACAGIDPALGMPVTIDVGTSNEDLLRDPFYPGLLQHRVPPHEYDALFDEFMHEAAMLFPGVLIQFEDFGTRNAFRLLARYRDHACCFNDDIQGTAAVCLAGLYSAIRAARVPELSAQKILFLGAGEAGIGIADLIVTALVADGMSHEAAARRCWFVDSKGLVVRSRPDLAGHKLPYAHDHAPIADLLTAVRQLRPTALIGVSGQGQAFTQPVIEAMSAIQARPIVFALSNPTANAECTAEQAYRWSEGRAVFASGSPFPAVAGERWSLVPSQANNAYIFPGIALGIVASGACRVTDAMFFAAARTLAASASDADLRRGSIFPPFSRIREVSAAIATAVATLAFDNSLTSSRRPPDLRSFIEARMYDTRYPTALETPVM
jgi:malate dehydrogenase (oxaloacetate-decarboxylating)(NADP+)